MTDHQPSITRVGAQYDRFGPCEHCGSNVTRMKTFMGTETAHLEAQVRRWERDPLLHTHCEGPYWVAHIDQEET